MAKSKTVFIKKIFFMKYTKKFRNTDSIIKIRVVIKKNMTS